MTVQCFIGRFDEYRGSILRIGSETLDHAIILARHQRLFPNQSANFTNGLCYLIDGIGCCCPSMNCGTNAFN